LGLGRSVLNATLLPLLLKGASPWVLANQFARKRKKKHNSQTTLERKTSRRSTTNENVTHVKSTIHET
jgi:hypothetical protein